VRRTLIPVIVILLAVALALPTMVYADTGTYIVQQGDTLSLIAGRLGVSSYMEIVELTNTMHGTDSSFAFIENPNVIEIGWKLAIPGSKTAALLGAVEQTDIAVEQTANLAALGVLDLVAPTDEALAGLPQGTIDAINAQIPAMYNAMVAALKDVAAYTVFMPTGASWARLSDAQLQTLVNDEATRTATWRNHVVSGTLMAAQLTDGQTLTTLAGQTLTVSRAGEQVSINGLPVVRADIEPPTGVLGSKGTIHVVDGILLTAGAVPQVGQGYTVVAGDTLFTIAARLLGDGHRYMEIVELTNAAGAGYAFIEDPNVIEIGWVLAIPAQ